MSPGTPIDKEAPDVHPGVIPATRAGSGVARRQTPSGRDEESPRLAGAGIQRMRRHVDKGTTDPWPIAPPGSEAVTILTDWGASDEKLINRISGNTSGADITNALCPPNALGQILILALDDQGGSFSITWDTSTCSTVVRSVIDGSSTYSSVELDDEGDNVVLLAVKKAGSLYWYLLDNNGAVLS